MIDLQTFSSSLTHLPNGIWITENISPVSYPLDASAKCFDLEEQSFWFRHRRNCLVTLVERIKPDGPLFDVGGGNGFISAELQKRGVESVVVEPSEHGTQRSLERGLKNIVRSTLEDARFKEGTIPAVGLFDVIEHVEDDTALLNQIKKLMRVGGCLFLTVPANPWLWSNEDQSAGHFRRYILDKLSGLLNSVGFQVIYATYFFSLLVVPIFIFRSIPTKLQFRGKNPGKEKPWNVTPMEHAVGHPNLSRVVQFLHQWEVEHIKKGKVIPFGSSCLIAANRI